MTAVASREPLVTIITPAHNAEPFIAAAIDSVRAQSWSNWEHIIVDDGSTDATDRICRSYAATDARIILRSTRNGGVSAARNLALAEARGEFLAFLDADDALTPDGIRARVRALEESGADVAGGRVALMDEGMAHVLRVYGSTYRGDFLRPLCRFDEGVFLGVFYVVRAASIRGAQFDTALRNSEDLLFWLSCCARRRLQYAGIDEDSYLYRHRPASASNNLAGWARAQPVLLRRIAAMDIGARNKFALLGRISRQLASYHGKRILGLTPRQFRGV